MSRIEKSGAPRQVTAKEPWDELARCAKIHLKSFPANFLMTRVLSISYDVSLLHTRELLLRGEGYKVESACGYSAAIHACQHGGFDLVVLGHSIPKGDKEQMINVIRTMSSTPILALSLPHEEPLKSADFTLNTLDPRIFLDAVKLGLRSGSPNRTLPR